MNSHSHLNQNQSGSDLLLPKLAHKTIKQAPQTKTLALTVNAKFHSLSLKFRLLIWLWPLIQSHIYILCKSTILRKEKEISFAMRRFPCSFHFSLQCKQEKFNRTSAWQLYCCPALSMAKFARFWKSASSKLWTQHNKKCSSFVVVVVAPHFPLPNFLVVSSCMRNSFMATNSRQLFQHSKNL